MNQKGFANIALVIVIAVLVSIGGYYFFKKPANVGMSPTPTVTPTATKTATPKPTAQLIKLTITSLQPTSGPVGARVTITGSGFTPTGNKVKFGNLGSQDNPSYSLSSPDGKTLVFTVPSSNYLSCWYSTPACKAPAYSTPPGAYGVSVINANGASNEILFTVTQ